ncbi:MAG TPA: STAS/SEC14 domain-containing protein [Verrucomicrobiae bacterium]|nr:STAS/SEC14 domain-containing protein [Verrucomicrobiae bacterium]
MSITIQENAGSGFVEVNILGTLEKADYEKFIPQIEEMIRQRGKVRLLVHFVNFTGFTAGAMWEDIKFDAKHFTHFERMAFVGDKKWESAMTQFVRPFTTAKVKYFDEAQMPQARVWLTEAD